MLMLWKFDAIGIFIGYIDFVIRYLHLDESVHGEIVSG